MLRRQTTRAPKLFGARSNQNTGDTASHPVSAANSPGRARPPAAGIVHDLPDGAGTAAALRRAAQTTIHLAGGPWSRLDIQGSPHVGVAEYIARTNNHGSPETSEVCWTAIDTDLAGTGQRKNSELIRIPILQLRPFNPRLTSRGATLGSLTLRSRLYKRPHLMRPHGSAPPQSRRPPPPPAPCRRPRPSPG
jgi:hypothetical protein